MKKVQSYVLKILHGISHEHIGHGEEDMEDEKFKTRNCKTDLLEVRMPRAAKHKLQEHLKEASFDRFRVRISQGGIPCNCDCAQEPWMCPSKSTGRHRTAFKLSSLVQADEEAHEDL